MKIFIIDSFTEVAFRGNPAGVCFVEAPLPDQTMLQIAQELNLSETAFLTPMEGTARFTIRFFSPKMEIALCGHATLASGKAVFTEYGHQEILFTTSSGLSLPVNADMGGIRMALPLYDTYPVEASQELLSALGVSRASNAAYNPETNILLLEIESATELAQLAPDFAALERSHKSINGVLVTAASTDGGFDFHSRYFWPWSGTNEDPVTGGTHTFLAKYWAQRLAKNDLRSFQSSRRSGSMQVRVMSDHVLVTSQAVIVLRGQMFLPLQAGNSAARSISSSP